jgi:prepilin-type N-terminal cleavage/methylation domain-containing protein
MKVRRRAGDDTGLTLVELLVTTTLLGIVLALATVGYITGLRVTDDNSARVEASDSAAAALEAVGRGLRTAVNRPDGTAAFTLANRTTVEFASTLYASCETPSTVRYSIDAGTLVEEITPSTGTARRRILARDIRNPAPFTFFRARPDATDPTRPQQLVEINSVPVSGADLAAIRAVDTSVSVRTRGRVDAPTVTAETRTFLVNANVYLNGGSGC